MRILLLSSFLVAILLTTNFAWADLPPSTSLKAEIPQTTYSYKSANGTTVVLGEVQNDNDVPIHKVVVYVKFFNGDSTNIETVTGTTLLQVIPPHSKSPFMISSTKSDPSIVSVQVNMGPFDSSPSEPQMLTISAGLKVSDKATLSGTINNNGVQKSLGTKVYLILYDAFQRVVRVGVSNAVDINSGGNAQFNIISDLDPRAISYAVVAESNTYQSKLNQNDLQVYPVHINSTIITGLNGTSYSVIPINSTIRITSILNHIVNLQQPFVYYVQVKQFNGKSEFIGKNDGVFLGLENQNASVNWTPNSSGSYFIETYVWDNKNIPLADFEPSINVILVK